MFVTVLEHLILFYSEKKFSHKYVATVLYSFNSPAHIKIFCCSRCDSSDAYIIKKLALVIKKENTKLKKNSSYLSKNLIHVYFNISKIFI